MPQRHDRRTFLAGVGTGTLAVAVGTSRAAASTAVPATLAESATAGTIHAGFPIDDVGLRWPAGTASVRIRFANSAGGFTPWQDVEAGCVAGARETPAEGVLSALVPANRAQVYEVDLPPGATSVAINTSDGPPLRSPAGGLGRTELAGCRYLSRAMWGADESMRFDESGAERFPQTYWPVQTVTVHHTATINDDPDPAARVRAIYRFQTIDEDFGDIGYHFLIDEAGHIYEGRFSGTDGLPGFNTARQMVNAAHVGGFNAGNVGIALLGTFTDRPPTTAARWSLTQLLALIASRLRTDPLATVNYVNPISGAKRTVSAIPGHRDWAATLCPGDILGGDLATIRHDAAELIARSSR